MGESWRKVITELQYKPQAGQQQLQVWTGATWSLNAVSLAGLLDILRPEKPFTDGGYVKSCMFSMVTELFVDFVDGENHLENKRRATVSQNNAWSRCHDEKNALTINEN